VRGAIDFVEIKVVALNSNDIFMKRVEACGGVTCAASCTHGQVESIDVLLIGIYNAWRRVAA